MTRSSRESQVQAVFLAAGVAIIAYVVGRIAVLGAALALGAVGYPVVGHPARALVLGVVMLQGVTFGGVALGYLALSDRDVSFLRIRVPSRRELLVTLAGFVALLGLFAAVSVLFSSLGIEAAQNRAVEAGEKAPIALLLLVPLSILLVGPGEELLFRGLIQGTLAEAFHPARAVVLASAVFALVHVSSLAGTGTQKAAYLGVVFLLSLVLGGLYEYTDNLVVPSLVHGAYNAVQFAAAYLTVTGQV